MPRGNAEWWQQWRTMITVTGTVTATNGVGVRGVGLVVAVVQYAPLQTR